VTHITLQTHIATNRIVILVRYLCVVLCISSLRVNLCTKVFTRAHGFQFGLRTKTHHKSFHYAHFVSKYSVDG
jgi:hypothetical protein